MLAKWACFSYTISTEFMSFRLQSQLLRLFIVSIVLLLMPFFASQGAFGQQESLSPDIQASLESGIELLRDGKIFEARQEFEHTLELDSHCYQAYNNIGLTYYRSGDLKKAAENYMKALELEPVFVPSITNLGAV